MYLNAERARGLMKDFEIDAIIASTPENVTYLAGTVTWAHQVYLYSVHMFAVFPWDEGTPPALIVPNQEAAYVSAQDSWIEDYYTFGRKSALVVPPDFVPADDEEAIYLGIMTDDGRREGNSAAALARALADRGLQGGRLALDEERVMPAVRRRLDELLPKATILDAGDLFRLIRAAKTPAELDALRAAAEVNERAGTEACKAVADGAVEEEVAAVYCREAGAGRAKWRWFHFGSGRRVKAACPPSKKKIQKGEMWKFDAGLSLHNFQADTGWGGVIGEPTEQQLALWRASETGFQAALAEIRAGALPSKIHRACMEATRAAGLPGHSGNMVGHAIGLETRELPYVLGESASVKSMFLGVTTDVPLEENAVLCVENPCTLFGVGGTQIEQTVVVTKNGWELLVPQERRLWVVPA